MGDHVTENTSGLDFDREKIALLAALRYVRHDAGLSQADVAARMGTHPSAVARLEQSLVTGKHSPSVDTLHRYVHACGKKLALKIM